ncbi:hypothetical protein SKAU_G00349990 [Synaphobranchus kaupii]|uniref:Uncharacterized protein n=1 Tax=Synaphobranchus kaupii TaxID=118154 RepID=A0A9Q1II21_SYNKA|nr:hypothetical protein SKAU_G00349990 [Synaphobranchus kaupii]
MCGITAAFSTARLSGPVARQDRELLRGCQYGNGSKETACLCQDTAPAVISLWKPCSPRSSEGSPSITPREICPLGLPLLGNELILPHQVIAGQIKRFTPTHTRQANAVSLSEPRMTVCRTELMELRFVFPLQLPHERTVPVTSYAHSLHKTALLSEVDDGSCMLQAHSCLYSHRCIRGNNILFGACWSRRLLGGESMVLLSAKARTPIPPRRGGAMCQGQHL